jgi:hypothetical protein
VVLVPPDTEVVVVVVDPAPVDLDRMPTALVVVDTAPDPPTALAVVGVMDGVGAAAAAVVGVVGEADEV